MMGAMFAVAIVVALALTRFARDGRFKADTLLGILAHGTLALGIVLVSINRDMNVDVNAYLFGDILAVGWEEVVVLAGLALVVLGILKHWFRPLLMATLDPDMAQVEGVNVVRAQMVLTLLLAAVIAVAIKLTGVLLITALLIMPAASARYFARTPYAMAIMASLIGMLAAPLGLGASLAIDAPSGPMIVVTAAVMFVLCALIAGKRS
jgi:zinc transport system permease protein